MEIKLIRQKREPLADTGPWVPKAAPFLFSFILGNLFLAIFSLQACNPSKASQLKLSLDYAGEFPIPQLQISPRDFYAVDQELWEQAFRVYVGDSLPSGEMADYPVLGSYLWEEGTFSFRPRFPWRPEQDYIAFFDPQKIGRALKQQSSLSQVFQFLPPRDDSRASILSVSPSLDSLPANTLRLYLYFDSPMREDSVYRYVKLLDEKGERIPQAFVEVIPPLFDPAAQRLTLIFHPGRVKQGIEFGERMGPVLEANRSYSLLVDTSWRDQRGRYLATHKPFHFVTTRADRISPVPANWTFESVPQIGSQEILELNFGDHLDEVLVRRMIHLVDEHSRPIPGETEASSSTWRFVPTGPWKAGKYRIIIDPQLEDLAGNRPGRLFDSKEKKGEEKEWYIPLELE